MSGPRRVMLAPAGGVGLSGIEALGFAVFGALAGPGRWPEPAPDVVAMLRI
jgi:hypothetical protein